MHVCSLGIAEPGIAGTDEYKHDTEILQSLEAKQGQRQRGQIFETILALTESDPCCYYFVDVSSTQD